VSQIERVKIVRPGMIIVVSVSMFDYKPERCPFGRQLWPGMAQVRHRIRLLPSRARQEPRPTLVAVSSPSPDATNR